MLVCAKTVHGNFISIVKRAEEESHPAYIEIGTEVSWPNWSDPCHFQGEKARILKTRI